MNYTFLFGALIFVFKDKVVPFFNNKAWLLCSCLLLFLTALFTADAPLIPEQRVSMVESMYKREPVFFYNSARHFPRIIIWGIPAAFFFVSFLAREAYFKKWYHSLMVKIGDASYSLYLVQAFTVLLLIRIAFLNNWYCRVFLALATIFAALKMFKVESIVGSYTKQRLKQKFL